ncbi:MAG: thiamine biosynthesis protein ThiF [Clostridia bacterium]|nr:thiamine biosynthesis protein ThiF [Clostridia bacterium]
MKDVVTKEELREALEERIGSQLLEKFESSTVAICGLGGLGSNIAISLARAGVGKLILIDFDRVDVSNMNRQQYKVAQIGMEKTEGLRENLREIAPYIELESHFVKLEDSNYHRLLKDADVICEAFDVAEEKSKLVDFAMENMPEKYLVAASGMAGLATPNSIKTHRVTSHFYLCGDGKSDVEKLGSLFAPRVMLCAAHQATTVLRILAGKMDV